MFASLPRGRHVRAGPKVHVLAAEAGELCDAQPGLDRDGQQRVIATTDPPGAVRCCQERVDFLGGEVGDDRPVVALGRDGEHAGDQVGVLWVAQRGVPEHRVDRGEARVAGAGTVAAVALEVIKKRLDQCGVEILDLQL